MHQFVSERSTNPSDFSQSDLQFICSVATDLQIFLNEMQSSADNWIATCARFLEMAFFFFRFVDGYRLGDSISIKHGYHNQLPIWQAFGQFIYVEITYAQNETLYRDSPFSTLQEMKNTRAVRRYHGMGGKC